MSETNTVPRLLIDANETHQSIDGFGASFAKQAHLLLRCAEPGRTQILELLFSRTNGAGLSIVRNQINSKSAEIDPDYGTIEPRNNTFDFDHDEAQIWLMKQAKHHGVTLFISTAFSPPAWMKINNNTIDNSDPPRPERNRLRRDRRSEYAEYLARYVREYRERFDIELYAISPANEPEISAAYQSCTWEAAELRDFIKDFLKPALAQQRVSIRLIAPETLAWSEKAYAAPIENDPETNAMVQIIGMHNYNLDPGTNEPGVYAEATAQTKALNKRLWLTEISSGEDDDPSMRDALIWAKTIHKHMVLAETNAWLWWWGVLGAATGAHFTTGQGLIYFRHEDGTFNVRKRFWCLAHYSRFIRPGAQRIGATASPIDGVYTSAYRSQNESTPTLVIVAINTTISEQLCTISLSNIAVDIFKPYVTSDALDMAEAASITVTNGELALSLAPRSIATLVGDIKRGESAPPPAHKIYIPHF
ncbi:MAG: glycoside hydrolase [Roseiflexaceae bacterium]